VADVAIATRDFESFSLRGDCAHKNIDQNQSNSKNADFLTYEADFSF
jgi:hypothetical protein